MKLSLKSIILLALMLLSAALGATLRPRIYLSDERRPINLAGAPTVTVWGSGTPRREFMYSEDMADACVYLMNLPDDKYTALLGSDESKTGKFEPPLINIGVGTDVTIKELAETIQTVVGYSGQIVFDASKPDGTPRKLMDVGRLTQQGWQAATSLEHGLRAAYQEFSKRRSSELLAA
jgi:GDP-L-fucose synthase